MEPERSPGALDGSCIEVKLLPGTYYSVLGGVQHWKSVVAGALEVERMHRLRGWAEWSAVYRVLAPGGRWHHYFVAEEACIGLADLAGAALVRVQATSAHACACPCLEIGHRGLCRAIGPSDGYYLALVGSTRWARSAALCASCVRALAAAGHLTDVVNRRDVLAGVHAHG